MSAQPIRATVSIVARERVSYEAKCPICDHPNRIKDDGDLTGSSETCEHFLRARAGQSATEFVFGC